MVTQLLLKWNGYQFQLEQNELADMFIGIADGTGRVKIFSHFSLQALA